MTVEPALQVRKTEPNDPVLADRSYDYADAFEIRLPQLDPHSPEAWVRSGFESTSPAVKAIVRLLGIRRAAGQPPNHMGTFRIVESGEDVIHLEAQLPLMRVVLVGRRVEPSRRMLTTLLYYDRPVLARLIWAVVGVGHRRTARRLITSLIAGKVQGS